MSIKMSELYELRSLLVTLAGVLRRREIDMQRAYGLMKRSRDTIKMIGDMKTSMRCSDSKSEPVCLALTDTADNPRCVWNGVCANTLPVGVPIEVDPKKVKKGVEKLQKKLEKEEVAPEVVTTLGTTPAVIQQIKKEPGMTTTKMLMYGTAVSSVLGVIGTLAMTSAVPEPVLESVASNVSDLFVLGANLGTAGVAASKLMQGARWLLNQRNLPDKVRDKVRKSVDTYTKSSHEIESELDQMKTVVSALQASLAEREETARKNEAYVEVLQNKLRRVSEEAEALADEVGDSCEQQLEVLKSRSAECITGIHMGKHVQDELESLRRQLSEKERQYKTLQERCSSDTKVVKQLEKCNHDLEARDARIANLMETDVGKALAKQELEMRAQELTRRTALELEMFKKDGTVPEWEHRDDPNAYSIADAKIQELIARINSGDSDEDDLIQLDWFTARLHATDEYRRIQAEKAEAERQANMIFELVSFPVQLSYFSYTAPYRYTDGRVDNLETAVENYANMVLTSDAAKPHEVEYIYGLMWNTLLSVPKKKPAPKQDPPKRAVPGGDFLSELKQKSKKPGGDFLSELKQKSGSKQPGSFLDEEVRDTTKSLMSELAGKLPARIEGGSFLDEIKTAKLKKNVKPKKGDDFKPKKAAPKQESGKDPHLRLTKEEFQTRVRARIQEYNNSSDEERKDAVHQFNTRVSRSMLNLMPKLYAYQRQRVVLDAARERGEDVTDLKRSIEVTESGLFGSLFIGKVSEYTYKMFDWVELQTAMHILPRKFEKESVSPDMQKSLRYILDVLIPTMKKKLLDQKTTVRNAVYTNPAFPPMGPFTILEDPHLNLPPESIK